MATTIYLWHVNGSGDGTYYPMTSKAGVVTLTAAGASPDDLDFQTYWPAFPGLSGNSALAYWNQYRQLRVETPGTARNYSGSWSAQNYPWSDAGVAKDYFEFSNTDAGMQIATAINNGQSWFVSLAGPTAEFLYPDEEGDQ